MAYPIYSADVRDAVTGEFNQALVGQQVQIVTRGTQTPYPILDAADDPISGSLLTVQAPSTVPSFYIDTATPSDVYLDWYHAGSGAQGPVKFEEALRGEVIATRVAASNAAASSDASNTAAQGALNAAQALDAVRMKLAGAAVAQGGTFWGVWSAGSAPVPPNDGGIHWGLEIVP